MNPSSGATRGRARGRSTAKPTTGGGSRAAGRAGPDPPLGQPAAFQPAPVPGASAWGQQARPTSAVAPGGRGSVGGAAAAAQASSGIRPGAPSVPAGREGRATVHRGGVLVEPVVPAQAPLTQPQRPVSVAGSTTSSTGASGGGDGPSGSRATDAARGAVRGKRPLEEILLTRPSNIQSKRGTAGRVLNLQANYFKLIKSPKWNLYQYRVDFSPNIEIEGLRKRLVYEQKPTLGGYLFDGTVIFVTRQLPKEVNEFMSKDRDGNPIQMTIKFVATVSMTTASSLQVLNLILRRAMEGLQLQLVGRNLFDARAKVDIREFSLQLWPGYVTSIRQHEQDLLVCAEMTFKVMRTETVYDIMKNTLQESRNFKEAFVQKVLGMTVLTDYNNKTYRVDDVAFDVTPASTFSTKNQGDISFVQYYQEKYHITIRDVKQPMLVSKVKERELRNNPNQQDVILLVPELCRATGLTDNMKSNFHLMAAVAKYTRLAPSDRVKKLMDFNKRLRDIPESTQVLNEWDMTLDKNMVELPGRLLDSEKIVFGGGRKVVVNAQADWTRELHSTPMFSSIDLKRWTVIYPRFCENETSNFIKNLLAAARGMQFVMNNPEFVSIQDDRVQTYSRAMDAAMNNDPQMLMIIVPNNNVDKYSNIKKKCCVERPIPSQVMVSRTIKARPGKERALMSVATKVAIQMNCKLGGAAWMTEVPGSRIMVIGFDVCHDTTDKSKSYGALVATMDMKKSCKYFSAVSAHKNGEELSDHFSLNVVKALKQYRAEHNELPDRILIYRDGVGEGQTQYVFEHEIKVLIKRLDEIYKSAGAAYRMSFTIVSKRINTRFFANGANPPPGTVVDDVVTLPERYDFFLVSQSSNVGTVSPTSYNIIYDQSGLSPNQHQAFSHKMTHLYYNWSGTLRVPAVCQYAHKLAFLVGQFIHQSPSNVLEKQLYFL